MRILPHLTNTLLKQRAAKLTTPYTNYASHNFQRRMKPGRQGEYQLISMTLSVPNKTD